MDNDTRALISITAMIAASIIAMAVAMAVAGCTTLPIYYTDAPGTVPDEAEDAAKLWGMRAEPSSEPNGAVHLDHVDEIEENPKARAVTHRKNPCAPSIEAKPEADYIDLAHELGHASGLGHTSDQPANIMQPWVGSDTTETTEEQRRRLKALAVTLRACRESEVLR